MITLPFEYKSGTTLLAELDAEHYITNRKKVIAKLTADNLWEKPVKPIKPVGELILLDNEYAELVADWKAFQAWATDNVTKHLAGQHDQSTHAGKKSYKSIDDLVKDGLDIQEAIDELGISGAADGNVAMRVLLERVGKGGKPEVVGAVADLDGEPFYRGAADITNDSFKTSEYDRIGLGQYGDGYYFSDNKLTAQDYAQRAVDDRIYGNTTAGVMIGGWKKDAKVYDVGNTDGWFDVATASNSNAIDKLNINTRASDAEDSIFNNFYGDYGNALVTDLILEGYDGMQIDIGLTETYTVVFNREAVQVVGN